MNSAGHRPGATCCMLPGRSLPGGRRRGHWRACPRRRLGVDWHETTPTAAVTLEPVFCLGLCAIGPAALLDGRPVGPAEAGEIDRMLETLS